MVITGKRIPRPAIDPVLGATSVGTHDIASQRDAASDSAQLLRNIPGVSLYSAGGVSSLPVVNGLADNRLRVQVNGMDLMPACPNHMNSALSYIDPTRVATATVFAGIAPVSVGGDSIGGTIQVKSRPPEFASSVTQTRVDGNIGAFFRSNGRARGENVGVRLIGHGVNLSYSGSSTQSDNYTAAATFKPAGPGHPGGRWLGGDEVGSSAYKSQNQSLSLAVGHTGRILQLDIDQQRIPYEFFPNQRMDMTANNSDQINLHYTGRYAWGNLKARLFDQNTRHAMDMGPDRYFYGTGMPMDTNGKTRGLQLRGDIELSRKDVLRIGGIAKVHQLYDWWPPVGGSMGPNTFWNVDYGTRNRAGMFGEWKRRWNSRWTSLLGIRGETVKTNAAPVQGYNTGGLWVVDAAAFNARKRQHTDRNWDLTALARYTPDANHTFEAGYARKTRSPSLYERYPWSTQAMAALMNNFVGDGNGYVGNPDLKPEVAHTVSASADWHAAHGDKWGLKISGHYTYVQDYIDAQRCNFGQCSAANLTTTNGFVLLQYVNQSARLWGMNVSGHMPLTRSKDFGHFTVTGILNYLRGENRTTGDNLYHIMPLNAKLGLVQKLGTWTNSADLRLVTAKTRISQVRNEFRTGGYALLNLHSSRQWKRLHIDFSIENLLNHFYSQPLGGAYLGQGASMTSNGIPWGISIPGKGRSIDVALGWQF